MTKRISYANGDYGTYKVYVVDNENEKLLVQVDYDFVPMAQSFGFAIAAVQCEGAARYCEHPKTDGTVACQRCGVTVGEFISAAIDYLDSNEGKIVEDPGYFDD